MPEPQVVDKVGPSSSSSGVMTDVVDGDSEYQSNFPGKLLYYSSADLPDQIDELNLNKQRKDVLKKSRWIVYGSILLSYCLGIFCFSIAWILLLVIVLHFFSNGTLSRVIKDCLIHEKRQQQRKKAAEGNETAEWLNFLLNRWWVQSQPSIFSWIKLNVDPILNNFKPYMFESVALKEFTFGSSTPFIASIRSYDLNKLKTSTSSASITSMFQQTFPLATPDLINYRLMLEAEVGISCPEFRIAFAGKSCGVELNFVIEKLIVSGKIHVIGYFGMEAAFPHLYKVSFKFIEKPKIDFDVNSLGTTVGMEVLGIRKYVQSLVMESLMESVIDPYEFIVNFGPNSSLLPASGSTMSYAVGVIRVSIGWLQNTGKQLTTKNEDDRWCTLKVGSQSYETCRSLPSTQWSDSQDFLIDSMNDRLIIKVKTKKRMFGNQTLATFDDSLESYFKDGKSTFEGQLQKNKIGISLKIEFRAILPLRSDRLNSNKHEVDEVDGAIDEVEEVPQDGVVNGVLYVIIHGAEGLVNTSKRLPNPYCVVFHNSKKIKTTHFINQSLNPTWESGVEFLVDDYTQSVITIGVYNWDSNKLTDAGRLGIAKVKSLTNSEVRRMDQVIPLELNENDVFSSNNKQNGSVRISIEFRPTPFITQQVIQEKSSSGVAKTDLKDEIYTNLTNHSPDSSKPVLTNGIEKHNSEIGNVTGLGLMEVVILRARNLIAKDLNGFSDPFCEIRINDEYYCKTTVKKRTLNPCWDEKLTIRLPRHGDTFSVILWDDDTFGKDFLGSVTFKIEDVRRLALADASEWFPLKETKSGDIEMKFRIISETYENNDNIYASTTSVSSAKKSPVLDSFRCRPNFYGEDVTDAVPVNNGNYCNGGSTGNGPPPIPDLPPKSKSQTLGSNSPALSIARTNSSASRTNGSESPHTSLRSATLAIAASHSISTSNIPNTSKYDYIKNKASPTKSRTHTLTPVPIPVPPERKSSLPTPVSNISPETISPTNGNGCNESVESSPLSRGSPAYSSFHEMKRKMKKTFTHPLRRFRSEACVHEDKSKNFKDRITIQAHDDVYSSCSNIEKLAVELNTSPTGDDSPINSNPSVDPMKPIRYYNIQGSVVQATGIDIPKESQICCRVKLLPCAKPNKGSKFSPKTISKSKLLPASPNPAFNLDFMLALPNGVPANFSLGFEIRKSNKEIVATKSLTLQELFEGAVEEGDEMRTCLSLSSGVNLEVVLSHGKENGHQKSQKSGSRLLRSWSVHRIGKI